MELTSLISNILDTFKGKFKIFNFFKHKFVDIWRFEYNFGSFIKSCL